MICLPDNVIFGTFSIHIQTSGKVSGKMEKRMMPVVRVLFISIPHGGKLLDAVEWSFWDFICLVNKEESLFHAHF